MESLPWSDYLTFCNMKLNIKPDEFWKLTFAEFWPMYNAVMGNTIKPLSRLETEDLEERWANGKNR